MTDFDALLVALTEHEVEFVIVGGAAAIAHGSARLTQDLDIVYERSPANLDRLVSALGECTTSLEDIDLLGEIPGGGQYQDLAAGAVEERRGGPETWRPWRSWRRSRKRGIERGCE